tara:strand:- start:282 stop:590 length:309 start_codon:yes stop_codon:yes gene_type:complete
LTFNKKQLKNKIYNFGQLLCVLIFSNFFISYQLTAQESSELNEIEINRNNIDDEDNVGLPTNPFEILDMIRRLNSMDDATNPSDAIDEAIKSFDMIKEEKQI